MSSMSSLYIGTSGLTVSQNALNTTAHNLANVDTKGYVRQQILFQDTKYKSLKVDHISSNQVGMGASIDIVRQVRDQFLDKSYRLEVGRQGFYDAQYTAVSELESVFGEMEGVAFQDSLEDFWKAMQELVKEPDNIVQRGTLVQTAVSFIERAELISNQIKEYQVNLNTEILNSVKSINAYGKQINELNDAIRRIEVGGVEQANDLRDTRNLLLDELGQLVNITYKENAEGVVTVSVEGVPFVTEDSVNEMSCTTMSDSSQMLKPIWEHINQDVYDLGKMTNSNDNSDVGYLKGLLVSRGDSAANYTDIPIAPKKEEFADEDAYNKALQQYEKEVDEFNNRINSSVIMNVQAQFDQLIHGIVTAVNDILCPNKTITVFEDGEYKEIKVLDEENAPTGMGEGNDHPGTELFTRKSTDRYSYEKVYLSDDPDSEPVWVYRYNEENEDDNYSLYTLGEIEVNTDILNNVSLLPLSSKDSKDEFDNKVCEQLKDIWDKTFATLGPNTMTECTFKNYYTALIGDLAIKGNTYDVIATNQGDMVNSIDNQRTSITGVSSDEELSNMIKYQHAYNAAARYVNVVSEMLEHVINSFFR